MIPSPSFFTRSPQSRYNQLYGVFEDRAFAALAMLKLGRDDDAFELASFSVSPEAKTEKKISLVTCHSILGQVAAKRGELDEAETHFANALVEAGLSRLPMLELLAARDWKKHLLAPNERNCDRAEVVIDGACAKMRKSREQLSSILEGGGGGIPLQGAVEC